MKRILLPCVASTALFSAQAQLFSPESLGGAAFGALIGGLAGGSSYSHGCHYHNELSGGGAAIGAGIGLLAGALVGEANRRDAYYSQPAHYAPAPAAQPGYGYPATYVYYAPNGYTAPGTYYRVSRPNYAVGGTLLGAASGALIGEGTHGKPGEGAAIGAAAGLVLGGLAEASARHHEKKITQTVQPNPTPSETQPGSQLQQTEPTPAAHDSVADNQQSSNQITSRPCSTSTYYWTTPPQIPDAPRVPDAPRF